MSEFNVWSVDMSARQQEPERVVLGNYISIP